MYKKISEFKSFDNKNYFFYETVFSENNINKVKSSKPDDYIILEFIEKKEDELILGGKSIYLNKTLDELKKVLQKYSKEKVLLVNIPNELLKYIGNKHFIIYSNRKPSDEDLLSLNYPLFIIGRNFYNQKQSDAYTNQAIVMKNKIFGFFEYLSIIGLGAFLYGFIYFLITHSRNPNGL